MLPDLLGRQRYHRPHWSCVPLDFDCEWYRVGRGQEAGIWVQGHAVNWARKPKINVHGIRERKDTEAHECTGNGLQSKPLRCRCLFHN